MKDSLTDIRRKLQEGAYQNEEHVRFSLVARLLQKLGWDIWDPSQVNAEFAAVPDEDRTKVDFALFSTPYAPSVFIEVKAVGKIADLAKTERQLRDYNRNNTALFCVITDGVIWRFYYSQTGGEFSNKCFKILDLQSDSPEDFERHLTAFLGKASLDGGHAKSEAEAVLELTQIQRAMQDCLPAARRLTQQAPFPRLPEALIQLVAEKGFPVSEQDADKFIRESTTKELSGPMARSPAPVERQKVRPSARSADEEVLDPDGPVDLRHTSITEACFGDERASNWNSLVTAGVRTALLSGHNVRELCTWLSTGGIREGRHTKSGFRPIAGTDVSFQNVAADVAWRHALVLARKLNRPLWARFYWREKEGASRPGTKAVLQWSPVP